MRLSDFLVMASLCGMSVVDARRCRMGLVFEMFNSRYRREDNE